MIGVDPQLIDPGNGNYRPAAGSPAESYGCRTFPEDGYFRRAESGSATSLVGAIRSDRIEVSGDIESDTVWSADTVCVVGNVQVLDGVTLVVNAGTRVEFDGHWALGIQGRILALGTAGERIYFTSANPMAFAIDSTLAGAWNGIRFEGTPAGNARSRLEYCVIEHSKSLRDSCMVGALLLDRYSGLDVVNTIIRGNVADWGAALYCIGFAAPTLTGCLITDNAAFQAGSAIHSTDSYPRLIACTVAGNFDLNPDGFAQAAPLMSMVSKPQTTCSIFWDNCSNFLWPEQLYEGKAFYTRYCDVEGGIRGQGCLDEQPLFIGDGPYPFGIQELSPCVDAGPPDTTGLGFPPLDLAGNPRISGGRVDMGAYEFQSMTSAPMIPSPILSLSAFPNPCNPRTEIRFTLTASTELSLTVYDLSGRRMRGLYRRAAAEAGMHRVEWNGCNDAGDPVASGLYLARVTTADGYKSSMKLILMK